jgi:TatD DNase family protein
MLAEELNLPVVMHSREAEADTLNILKEIPVKSLGVAHSFTSSFEMARTLVEMGWYLGINGIVTFKNTEDLREVVRWLPLEKMLLETDSPFLTPVPFRGKPNKPAHIPVIATFISELRDISLQELAEQTNENAQRLFKLPYES